MTWFYHNTTEEFKEDQICDNVGFVYLITHIKSGRKYVGKKLFTKAGSRQINGKKKKIRKSSDWLTYWGSNDELKEEIVFNGENEYTREILYLCKTKSELSYYETFEIFNRHALISDSYYNSWVSCRINKKNLNSLKGKHGS